MQLRSRTARTARTARRQRRPPQPTRRSSRRQIRPISQRPTPENTVEETTAFENGTSALDVDPSTLNLPVEPSFRPTQHTIAFILNPIAADCSTIDPEENSRLGHPSISPDTFDGDYDFGYPEPDYQLRNESEFPYPVTADPNMESAATTASSIRGGRTNKWIDGYKYTRIDQNLTKVYYRCSHYRSIKCKGKCEFVLALEAYHKFVPHTCGRSAIHQDETSIGARVERDVSEAMKREVDMLAVSTTSNRAEIWDIVRTKFYDTQERNLAISGLTKDEVLRRVNRARADEYGGSVYTQIDVSPWCWIQMDDGTPSQINFFLFHYSYYDRVAKERQRVLGYAHPVLLNMLKHKKTDVFVDGTFRSVPPKFKQCIIFSTYDRPTRSYYPAAFVLSTSKKYEAYFHAMRLVLDETDYALDPEFVYCDFEAGLIRAIKDHFPHATTVGCLFHFKQACRRKMKEYGISKLECSIAMRHGILDMLTVMKQDKVKKQGIPWVRGKIEAECLKIGLAYAMDKWSRFWTYFKRTWIKRFSPSLWKVEPISRAVISRTNNPLERFNREMNATFKAPHPSLPEFVVGIEKLVRRYANQKFDIEIGRAKTPARLPIILPKPIIFPDIQEDSESSSSSIEETSSSEEDASIVVRPGRRSIIAPRGQGPNSAMPEEWTNVQERTGYYEDLGE